MNRISGRIGILAVALLVVIVVTPARGRAELRLDWSAWLGCWQPVGTGAEQGVVVCLLPGEDAQSVRMVTIAANTIREQSVIRADGVGRPRTEGGCSGLETATWSNDRRRVFIRTELECGSIDRTATSVMAFVASDEFIDAQAITVNGQHAGRSVRYRALPADQTPAIVASELAGDRNLIAETARLDAFVPMDVDDVIEAADRVAPPALEALLAARSHGFALDSRALMRLEGEGVPRSVMNVMIALSYPKHFNVRDNVVEEEPRQRYGYRDDARQCYDAYYRIWRYGRDCYDNFFYDPFYFDRYGYRSRYGYGLGGSYHYPWSPTPVVVIVRNDDPQQLGEVVKGQGYTNGSGRPTGAAAVPRSSTSSGTASTGRSSSVGSGGSSSTSSGSASSSSGSSGTSTGRTAVRRGGGGEPPSTPPPEQAQRYEPAPVQAPPPAPRNDPPPVVRNDPPPTPPVEPTEPVRTAVRKPGGG